MDRASDAAIGTANKCGENFGLKDMDGLQLFVSTKGAKSRFNQLFRYAVVEKGLMTLPRQISTFCRESPTSSDEQSLFAHGGSSCLPAEVASLWRQCRNDLE